MAFSRRNFLVMLRNTVFGSFLLPGGSGTGTVEAASTSQPVRNLLSLPTKADLDDGFLLLWMEETEDGVESMMWRATTEEEIAEAEKFYETARDFDTAATEKALDKRKSIKRSKAETTLLRDILDHWDDLAPRFAYAEWLCRNGRGEGEFIRLWTQMDGVPTDEPDRPHLEKHWDELSERYAMELVAPLATLRLKPMTAGILCPGLWLDCGLLTRVEIDRPGVLPKQAKALFNAAPLLREVTLTYDKPDIPGIVSRPEMNQLVLLELSSCELQGSDVKAIVESSHLTGLKMLDIGYNTLGATAGRLLGKSTLLGQLTSLNVRDCRLTDDGLREIASSECPVMEELQIQNNVLSSEGLELFFNSAGLPKLSTLGLGIGLDDEQDEAALVDSAPALAGSAFARQLRQLIVEGGLRDGLLSLCESEWPRLQVLKISSNELTLAGITELASSPKFPELRELDLSWNAVDAAGAAALAASSHLTKLRQLDLSFNPLGEDGLRELADASWLGGLTELKLHETEAGPAGTAALAANPRLSSLRELDLSGNVIGSGGAQALAKSSSLANLTALAVDEDAVGRAGHAALTARFGEDVLSWW